MLHGLYYSFEMFITSSAALRFRGRLTMIWHVMVWSIWKSLNDIVLSRSSLTQKEVEDMCIFLAKKWYRNRPVEYG